MYIVSNCAVCLMNLHFICHCCQNKYISDSRTMINMSYTYINRESTVVEVCSVGGCCRDAGVVCKACGYMDDFICRASRNHILLPSLSNLIV